jgi:hypothetical protein
MAFIQSSMEESEEEGTIPQKQSGTMKYHLQSGKSNSQTAKTEAHSSD